MGPDLDVVIVTYNSIHVIDALLDSLPAALDGLAGDVVVVDNGSADGTADRVEARGDCRVVRSTNTGYASGINLGVREAVPAESILVLNPDVRLHEKSIPPLLAALAEPGVGIAVPRILSSGGKLELSLRREPTLPRALGLGWTRLPAFAETVHRRADYATPREVDWAVGAVMAVSRKCHDVLEGWDESYFMYSEETDLCLRARDAGLRTRYVPHARAVHIGGQSGRDSRTHVIQVVNRVRLYRRRHGPFASWCFFALMAARQLVRWLIHGRQDAKAAALALALPSRRPRMLRCGGRLMPR
jgi:N-acetylglucosaminyl-diphospho-decaprenol L-rhamnosyltransferase